MTATERLRAMLDELGVEWRRTPHYSSESIDNETVFRGEGIEWIASDHFNGHIGLRALRYEVTPEQAIEATLGRGENEQLRKERDALDHLTDVLNATNDGLLAENAKLRELVRISIEFCADGMCGIYEGGPLNAADGRCRFDDRARELGVEVDA